MRTILLVSLITVTLAFSSPTKPKHDTAFTAPPEEITLMALDHDGVFTVNDDTGKLLGKILPDGTLKLAPHTSQKAFLLGVINDLRDGIPVNDSSQAKLDQCVAVLNHILEEEQGTDDNLPITNKPPASRINYTMPTICNNPDNHCFGNAPDWFQSYPVVPHCGCPEGSICSCSN